MQGTKGDITLEIAMIVSSALNVPFGKVVALFTNNIDKSDILFKFVCGTSPTLYFLLYPDGSININDEPGNDYDSLCVFVVNVAKNRQVQTKTDIIIGSIDLSTFGSLFHSTTHDYILNRIFLPYTMMLENTIPNIIIEQIITLALDCSIRNKQKKSSRSVTDLPVVANLDIILKNNYKLPQDTHERTKALQLEIYLIKWTEIIEQKSIFCERDTISQSGEMMESENDYMLWERHKKNLESLVVQLQSTRVRKILKALDRAESKLNIEFAMTCKKLFWSLNEAQSNERFLRPLKVYFDAISNETNISKLPGHCHKLIHLFLCVWSVSTYYNTKCYLVRFFRKMGNYLVSRAKNILMNIRQNGSSPALEIINSIICQNKRAIKAIGTFKSIVVKYKKLSYEKCRDNPWNVDTSILIGTIDNFLDECQIMNEILKGVEHYDLLRYISCREFNGKIYHDVTKQISREISSIYSQVMETFAGSRSKSSCCRSLYERKCITLKKRLLWIDDQFGVSILHMLDQSPEWMKIKILSTFISIISRRKVVLMRLKTCICKVLQQCLFDVKSLKTIFIQQTFDKVFLKHVSPAIEAITWCRALVGRAGSTIKTWSSFDFSHCFEHERYLHQEFVYFEGDARNYERRCWRILNLRFIDNDIFRRKKIQVFKKVEFWKYTKKAFPKYLLSLNINQNDLQNVKDIKHTLRSNIDSRDKRELISCVYNHLFSLFTLTSQFNRMQLNMTEIELSLLRKSLQFNEKLRFDEIPFDMIDTSDFDFYLGSQGVCDIIASMKKAIDHIESEYIKIKTNLVNINLICIKIKHSCFIMSMQRKLQINDLIEAKARIKVEDRKIKSFLKSISSQLQQLRLNLNIDLGCKIWNQFVQYVDSKVTESLFQAMIKNLSLFEKSFLSRYNRCSILIEMKFVKPFKKKLLQENEKHVLSFFVLLNQILNAAVKLCGTTKCIDSRKKSYLEDLLSSSNVILYLSRIRHKMVVCLFKTKKLMKKISDISFSITDGPRMIMKKIEKKSEEGKCISYISEISGFIENSLKHWTGVQNRIHNLRDEYDIDFISIKTYKAKVSFDIEIFNFSSKIIGNIINYTKDIEMKLNKMEINSELEKKSPDDFKRELSQFNLFYSEIEQVEILFKHNDILSESFKAQYSRIQQLKLKWETKITNIFKK